MNKKLIAPIVAAGAMLFTSVGSTFALFTSKASSEINIQAGKVNVAMSILNYKTYSGSWNSATSVYDFVETETGKFSNGGTAVLVDNVLTLDKVSPMDKVEFDVAFENNSNISIKYRLLNEIVTDNGLFNGLEVKIGDTVFDGFTKCTQWEEIESGTGIEGYHVSILLPENAGNEYQETTCSIKFGVEAVQANAHVEDVPNDPTADYIIVNKGDLLRFADLVNKGSVRTNAKVVLGADIDLESNPWTPIGSREGGYFVGTFDGLGHTISNLKIEEGNKYTGFFGYTGSSTIKNLNFKNVNLASKSHWVGTAVGYLYGGKAENITISGDVKIDAHESDGSFYVGGVIGKSEGLNGSELKVLANEGSTISAGYYVGGIIGFQGNTGAMTFDKCAVKGVTISAVADSEGGYGAGGIMGLAQDGNVISNSEVDVKIYNGGALAGGYGVNVSFLNNTGKATIDGDYICEDLGGNKRFANSSMTSTDNTIEITNLVSSLEYTIDSSTLKLMKKLGNKEAVEANDGDISKFAGRIFVKNGANYELAEEGKTIGSLATGGTVDLLLMSGEYVLGGSGTVKLNLHGYVTSEGVKTSTILSYSGSATGGGYFTIAGMDLVVDHVNVKGTVSGGWYRGIQTKTIEYHNCHFTGGTTNYADKCDYYDCTFDATNINNGGKADYSIYCYNTYSTFKGCSFVSAGKAVKIYSEGNKNGGVYNFENCTFAIGDNLLTPNGGKAAIEIDSRYQLVNYEVNVKNCSQVGYERGLAADSSTNSTINLL